MLNDEIIGSIATKTFPQSYFDETREWTLHRPRHAEIRYLLSLTLLMLTSRLLNVIVTFSSIKTATATLVGGCTSNWQGWSTSWIQTCMFSTQKTFFHMSFVSTKSCSRPFQHLITVFYQSDWRVQHFYDFRPRSILLCIIHESLTKKMTVLWEVLQVSSFSPQTRPAFPPCAKGYLERPDWNVECESNYYVAFKHSSGDPH